MVVAIFRTSWRLSAVLILIPLVLSCFAAPQAFAFAPVSILAVVVGAWLGMTANKPELERKTKEHHDRVA
jgi:hypothetical protein